MNGVYDYPHVASNRLLWNTLRGAQLGKTTRPSMAYRDALTSLLTKFLIRTPSLDEITSGIDACLDELRDAAPADHLVPVELDDAWRTAARWTALRRRPRAHR